MLMPLVSVVIPTYNYAQYVGQAVQSVLAQDYPNLEIFVIDDGSTDNTQEVLKPYMGQIQYIYKTNSGTAGACNVGFSRATGKYICWLSSDDLFFPTKVSKQVALMESQPVLGFAYSSFIVIDGNGVKTREVHSPFFPERREMVKQLYGAGFINGSSVIMRRSALNQIGYFEPAMDTVHDYDLWFRFLRVFPCAFMDEFLIAYRWHGKNNTLTITPDYMEPARKRACELFPEWLGVYPYRP